MFKIGKTWNDKNSDLRNDKDRMKEGMMMNRGFLIECPEALKQGLYANKHAMEQFFYLDFFKQRSLCNYIKHAKNENDCTQRVNEVLASLIEGRNVSKN